MPPGETMRGSEARKAAGRGRRQSRLEASTASKGPNSSGRAHASPSVKRRRRQSTPAGAEATNQLRRQQGVWSSVWREACVIRACGCSKQRQPIQNWVLGFGATQALRSFICTLSLAGQTRIWILVDSTGATADEEQKQQSWRHTRSRQIAPGEDALLKRSARQPLALGQPLRSLCESRGEVQAHNGLEATSQLKRSAADGAPNVSGAALAACVLSY